MKPPIALVALFISACGGTLAEPGPAPVGPGPVTDPCGLGRPDFGAIATAADRDLFSYDVNAPLNLQVALETTNDGVKVSGVSFDSPDGGTVLGVLFEPVARTGLRPGVVFMHGAPGTARSAYVMEEAQLLASAGAVVIAISAPFNRRSGAPIRFIAEEDRAEQIQLIKDLQRAVDVLIARADVDSERIAYVGISYGAATGALFVGIERRLQAAVLVVGDGGPVSHETGPEDVFFASLPCATRASWLEAMTPIEPIRFIPHAPPTALLLQNGQSDALVPMADAQALHVAAPEPKKIIWYSAGHALNLQAKFDRYDWLHEQIAIDARQ